MPRGCLGCRRGVGACQVERSAHVEAGSWLGRGESGDNLSGGLSWLKPQLEGDVVREEMKLRLRGAP